MSTKVVFLFAAFVAVNASLHGALINAGSSASFRQQDDFGNYAFNYGIVDGLGATNGRAEIGDAHGNKKGTYTITDIDGRARRVDYVADGFGFRAAVKTNEPGTALSAPAAAIIASPYAAPVAPAVVGHSVVAAAPVASVAGPVPIAAPVYAGAPAVVTSKVLTASTVGLAGAFGYAADHIGIARPVGYAAGPVGYAAEPAGYAAGPVGYAAGLAGYTARPVGIPAPIAYSGFHGIAAPLGYAGHLSYGVGSEKVIS